MQAGTYQVLDRLPHDPCAFTRGIQMVNQTHYYERLGLYGESAVRIVELRTGHPVRVNEMSDEFFREGIKFTNGSTNSVHCRHDFEVNHIVVVVVVVGIHDMN